MNCILVLCGNHLQEFFPVKEGVARIGRESDNEIQLLDETVSRHHAQLSNMPNTCEIEDHNSANGTFINGKRVQSGALRHGDELKFGSTIMRFEVTDNELADESGKSRDYSALSQHSTVRVKKHPADMQVPTPEQETTTFTAPKITIKRKKEE